MSVFSQVFTNHKFNVLLTQIDVRLRRSLMKADVGAQCNLVTYTSAIEIQPSVLIEFGFCSFYTEVLLSNLIWALHYVIGEWAPVVKFVVFFMVIFHIFLNLVKFLIHIVIVLLVLLLFLVSRKFECDRDILLIVSLLVEFLGFYNYSTGR